MTNPLYFVDLDLLAWADQEQDQNLVLDGAEGHHAATVRRSLPGEAIDLADGLGGLAHGVVAQVGKDTLTVTVHTVEAVQAPQPSLVLVQALAKNGRDEQAVESATELGIDRIVPWQAQRCVVVWNGDRGRRALAKWVNLTRAAAKQSRRPLVPEVSPAHTSAQVSQAIVAARAAGGAALVLHEQAEIGWSQAVRGCSLTLSQILLVVGPEGGITPQELTEFTAAGAQPVRLGPTVLRSSSAGPAAIAALAAALGRWG